MTDYAELKGRAVAASTHIPGCPGDEECWRYDDCTHRDLITVAPGEIVGLITNTERLHSVLSSIWGVINEEQVSNLRHRLMKSHVVVSEAAEDVAQLHERIRVLDADLALAKELLAEHEWCGKSNGWQCKHCRAFFFADVHRDLHDTDCPLAVFLGLPRDE